MNIIEISIIAIGLAMDAFAVALCKGVAFPKTTPKNILIVGGYFGLFQALMTLIGYFLGTSFSSLISSLDHWLIFSLLVIIGINMIREIDSDNENINAETSIREMLPPALATSIDALGVGITLSFFKGSIIYYSLIIGIITFILSMIGVKIGHNFGLKYEDKAKMIGGIILIFIAFKILVEHLYFV